jgi:site-specific recombinase XerD
MPRLVKITAVQERSWQDIFEEFLALRIASGAAPRTIEDYRYHVEKFFKQHPEAWGKYEMLRECVIHYFASLVKAEKSPAYHNIIRENLIGFFNYCLSIGALPANPVMGISKREDESKARNIPEEDVLKLLEAPDTTTWPGLRDYALLLLMLDTGIRPKEAFSLRPKDFNLRAREVTVPAKYAKTRISRTLPFSPATRDAIQKVLSVRLPEWDKDAPVFASCDGKETTPTNFTRRLQEYSKAKGLETHVTSYMLRHTFAISYLRNGGNLLELQRMLGHKDLTMTKRYLALAQEDMKADHEHASPTMKFLAKKKKLRLIRQQ